LFGDAVGLVSRTQWPPPSAAPSNRPSVPAPAAPETAPAATIRSPCAASVGAASWGRKARPDTEAGRSSHQCCRRRSPQPPTTPLAKLKLPKNFISRSTQRHDQCALVAYRYKAKRFSSATRCSKDLCRQPTRTASARSRRWRADYIVSNGIAYPQQRTLILRGLNKISKIGQCRGPARQHPQNSTVIYDDCRATSPHGLEFLTSDPTTIYISHGAPCTSACVAWACAIRAINLRRERQGGGRARGATRQIVGMDWQPRR